METNYRKFTSLSFLALSALVGYVLFLILTEVANIAKIGGSDTLGTGLSWNVVGGSFSALVSLIGFIVLMTNKIATEFTDDVFAELHRVTWPSLKETGQSTLVVSITVIIAAVMFFLMDLLWGGVFEWVI